MTDEDLQALYYFFRHAVTPLDEVNTPTHLPFPFNLRFSMKFWDLMFANLQCFQADNSKSAEWN